MKYNLYDKVMLTNGREATIVEIYEKDKAFEADILMSDGEYETETIYDSDIANKLI